MSKFEVFEEIPMGYDLIDCVVCNKKDIHYFIISDTGIGEWICSEECVNMYMLQNM